MEVQPDAAVPALPGADAARWRLLGLPRMRRKPLPGWASMSTELSPQKLQFAIQDLHALEDTVERLEERVEALEEENQRKDQRIAELQSRTDLLSIVEQADEMSGKQRSVALLQHLRRKAERQAENDRRRMASVTQEQAEEALSHPDIHRTTYHSDFDRAERLVGDDDICYYEGEPEARLVLNIEGVDFDSYLNRIQGGQDGC